MNAVGDPAIQVHLKKYETEGKHLERARHFSSIDGKRKKGKKRPFEPYLVGSLGPPLAMKSPKCL